MSLEAGRINLSQIQGSNPRVAVDNTQQGLTSIRNDQTINVPLNAFIPGTPINTGNNIRIIPYYTGAPDFGQVQILSQQSANGVTVTHARNIAPGYNGVIVQGPETGNSYGPIQTPNYYQNTTPQAQAPSTAGGQYNKDYVAAQVEKFKKGRPESDGKFTFGEFFKNVGKGMLKEVENIGKALTTPAGFLTAAAAIAVSIAFPPAGLVIAGGFLAYGIGKTAVGGYHVAKELANGNPDAAERAGQEVGGGLVDTGIAALGFRGALKSFKAWKAGPSGGTAGANGTPKQPGPGPNPNQKALPGANPNQKALPAPENTTTGNASGGPVPGQKALPAPQHTATGNTTGNVNANPRITQNAGTNTSSFFQQAQARINTAENVSFRDPHLGRVSANTVKNPYKVLGLDPKNFSTSQLKGTYRKLAVEFHPDKGVSNGQYMSDINTAYEILSNTSRRAAVNSALGF